MKNWYSHQFLGIIDEILYDKKLNEETKQKLNQLSSSDISELLKEYKDILDFYRVEKEPVPYLLKQRVSQYFERLSYKSQENLPELVVKYLNQTFEIVKNTLVSFNSELVPLVSVRDREGISTNKVLLVQNIEDKKVEISLIPQREKFLLSFYLRNLTGNLTIKLKENNIVTDIKHFANLSMEERGNFENLKKGNYVVDIRGAYNNKFILKIEGE